MFSKAKIVLFFATIVGILTTFARYMGKKAGKAEVIAKSQEAANEYKEAGYEAARVGEIAEREVVKEPIDTDKRDHFE